MAEQINNLSLDSHNFPKRRYEPIEMLGKGALGEVFLARDVTLKRTVAVKRLISITDDQVVLFHREARIASRLSHANVITILDFGTTDSGRPYMALEYFNGISLERLIEQRGRMEESLVVKIFITIADALDYIHQHKIFHRDLKPSNVLLKLDDQDNLVDLRVIDFGLSCIKEDVQNNKLKQGLSLVGTPLYMSPDPLAGSEFDARSEVYSMGCLMYEALTGAPPFDGEGPMDLLEQHAHAEPVPLRELVPANAISPSIERVVLKCLAKSPADRYQNMREFIESIDHGQTASSVDIQAIASLSKPVSRWAKASVALSVLVIGCAFVMTLSTVLSTSKGGKVRDGEVKGAKGEEEGDVAFSKLAPQEFGIGQVPDIDAGEKGLYFWGDESFERLEALARGGKKRDIVTLRGMRLGKKEVDCVNALFPRMVRLQHSELTSDDTLRQLSTSVRLSELVCLDCVNITPTGLASLRSAPSLSSLVLANCGITDAHLEALRALPNLRKLVLERNQEITDSALRQLGKRERPLAVWLDRNTISEKAIAELKNRQNIFVVTKDIPVEEGLISDPATVGRQ